MNNAYIKRVHYALLYGIFPSPKEVYKTSPSSTYKRLNPPLLVVDGRDVPLLVGTSGAFPDLDRSPIHMSILDIQAELLVLCRSWSSQYTLCASYDLLTSIIDTDLARLLVKVPVLDIVEVLGSLVLDLVLEEAETMRRETVMDR